MEILDFSDNKSGMLLRIVSVLKKKTRERVRKLWRNRLLMIIILAPADRSCPVSVGFWLYCIILFICLFFFSLSLYVKDKIINEYYILSLGIMEYNSQLNVSLLKKSTCILKTMTYPFFQNLG